MRELLRAFPRNKGENWTRHADEQIENADKSVDETIESIVANATHIRKLQELNKKKENKKTTVESNNHATFPYSNCTKTKQQDAKKSFQLQNFNLAPSFVIRKRKFDDGACPIVPDVLLPGMERYGQDSWKHLNQVDKTSNMFPPKKCTENITAMQSKISPIPDFIAKDFPLNFGDELTPLMDVKPKTVGSESASAATTLHYQAKFNDCEDEERYRKNYSTAADNSQISVGYKNILIWNEEQRTETANFGNTGHEPFVQHKCEISDCAIYDQTSSVLPPQEYDAIVIHMLFFKLHQLPDFKRQSPEMMPIYISAIDNVFNWTMTYKLDSDIQFLYGRIIPGPTAPRNQEDVNKMIAETHSRSVKNYAANKTRSIAWMVSHCETSSNRESYVTQLSKFIPVDVYGKCGDLSCPRNEANWVSDPKCYDMLEAKYKFYLSFENSICTDYVTEKFFEIMKHDMIPIVYGGANYSQIAPFHSYINALEFTPGKLAEYLKMLDENDTLYNEYFWWKDHYRVESGEEQMARHGFCDLCKKLHQDQGVVKYYQELVPTWHPNTQCRRFVSWENFPQSNIDRILSGLLSFIRQFI
ncbi:hypothetical protein GHT06_010489 [Daphnia sinensis]|uniref:Fucosyltransferase n=1 Tax=Daphnia sinensis TaxID=1820382 RepID=A0AAD5L141_9CRUS|nr:hypothetical protein GHT06_010489 [Daphnia sinensis]